MECASTPALRGGKTSSENYISVRHYTFIEAARLLGVTPADIRLMVEEGRLRSVRRGGTRMIADQELAREEASEDGSAGVAPPLQVVLARLEEKAAELAEVRRELDHARSRHAEELKALRREVRELRNGARQAQGEPPSRPRSDRRMRHSLGPLFGVNPEDQPTDG